MAVTKKVNPNTQPSRIANVYNQSQGSGAQTIDVSELESFEWTPSASRYVHPDGWRMRKQDMVCAEALTRDGLEFEVRVGDYNGVKYATVQW